MKQTTLFDNHVKRMETKQNPLTSDTDFHEPKLKTVHYKPSSIDREEIPGFDTSLKNWIYPINYPIREYQLQIVQECLFKNTMVCLPTGLGKTFIASVVMYNFYRWYPSGKIIFLAPTRPLVSQQMVACQQTVPLDPDVVLEMNGSISQNSRIDLWKQKRVFFLTAQVLVNDLISGICPGKEIVTVVLDEAHKASKNHAYCQVIRELTGPQHENRLFRVVGLSATPGDDISSIQDVLQNLLISHIELRTDECADIKRYSHARLVEEVVVPLGDEVIDCRDRLLKICEPIIEYLKRASAINSSFTMNKLTKYGLLKMKDEYRSNNAGYHSYSIQTAFAQAISLYYAIELVQQHGLMPTFLYFENALTANCQSTMPQISTLMTTNRDFMDFYEALRDKLSTHSQVLGHPKLLKLRDIVRQHFSSKPADEQKSTRVIVFSQIRDSVEEIIKILRPLEPAVRPIAFMGKSKQVSQRKQMEAMSLFANGTHNVLVSTCIGEEGLDIGDVDLIICFDSQKSPIRLIQRVGRTGRKRKGRIVMLLSEGKEVKNYRTSLTKKSRIHSAIFEGYKHLVFYPDNPRMVPMGLDPVVSYETVKIVMNQPETKTKSSSNRNSISRYLVKGTGKVEDGKSSGRNQKLSLPPPPPLNSEPFRPCALRFLGEKKSTSTSTFTDQYGTSRYRKTLYRAMPSFRIGHSDLTRNFVSILKLKEMHCRGTTNIRFHLSSSRVIDIDESMSLSEENADNDDDNNNNNGDDDDDKKDRKRNRDSEMEPMLEQEHDDERNEEEEEGEQFSFSLTSDDEDDFDLSVDEVRELSITDHHGNVEMSCLKVINSNNKTEKEPIVVINFHCSLAIKPAPLEMEFRNLLRNIEINKPQISPLQSIDRLIEKAVLCQSKPNPHHHEDDGSKGTKSSVPSMPENIDYFAPPMAAKEKCDIDFSRCSSFRRDDMNILCTSTPIRPINDNKINIGKIDNNKINIGEIDNNKANIGKINNKIYNKKVNNGNQRALSLKNILDSFKIPSITKPPSTSSSPFPSPSSTTNEIGLEKKNRSLLQSFCIPVTNKPLTSMIDIFGDGNTADDAKSFNDTNAGQQQRSNQTSELKCDLSSDLFDSMIMLSIYGGGGDGDDDDDRNNLTDEDLFSDDDLFSPLSIDEEINDDQDKPEEEAEGGGEQGKDKDASNGSIMTILNDHNGDHCDGGGSNGSDSSECFLITKSVLHNENIENQSTIDNDDDENKGKPSIVTPFHGDSYDLTDKNWISTPNLTISKLDSTSISTKYGESIRESIDLGDSDDDMDGFDYSPCLSFSKSSPINGNTIMDKKSIMIDSDNDRIDFSPCFLSSSPIKKNIVKGKSMPIDSGDGSIDFFDSHLFSDCNEKTIRSKSPSFGSSLEQVAEEEEEDDDDDIFVDREEGETINDIETAVTKSNELDFGENQNKAAVTQNQNVSKSQQSSPICGGNKPGKMHDSSFDSILNFDIDFCAAANSENTESIQQQQQEQDREPRSSGLLKKAKRRSGKRKLNQDVRQFFISQADIVDRKLYHDNSDDDVSSDDNGDDDSFIDDGQEIDENCDPSIIDNSQMHQIYLQSIKSPRPFSSVAIETLDGIPNDAVARGTNNGREAVPFIYSQPRHGNGHRSNDDDDDDDDYIMDSFVVPDDFISTPVSTRKRRRKNGNNRSPLSSSFSSPFAGKRFRRLAQIND